MNLSHMSPIKQRMTISTVSVAILLVVIYLSIFSAFKPIFILIVATIITIAMWEYYRIAQAMKYQPIGNLGFCFAVLYAFATFLGTQHPRFQILPTIILGLTLLSSFLYYFTKGTEPFINLAITIFGFAYLAIPLCCMININYFFSQSEVQDGRWWLLYLIAVTKMTDTGAYFFGKKFGRSKLAPFISPKKTWEGAYGGLMTAIGTSIFFFFLTSAISAHFQLTFWQSIWLGALIGILAQIGDLAESLLKRNGGVKDSNQLPGLGGLLDIVDSLVFTAPAVYIFLKL
jgi:phosphatidate cytidylyltransferase